MDCSICIATYKRPDLLNNLLKSLIFQKDVDGLSIEVIVVDNDKQSSAQKVCDPYKDKWDKFTYLTEERKNISYARNKAVNNAVGKYILFIDDDETASSRWIYELMFSLKKYSADGVFGRVVPTFGNDISYERREVYSRFVSKSYLNKGSKLTGSLATNTSTANCIIKSDVLKKYQGPFDSKYGITGGSDTHLFKKIKKSGFKLIYSYESLVFELVPKERTSFNWLMRRSFRCNNIYTRILIEEKVKNKIFFYLYKFFRTIIILPVIALIVLLISPSKALRVHWSLKIASNLGALLALFKYRYFEYR